MTHPDQAILALKVKLLEAANQLREAEVTNQRAEILALKRLIREIKPYITIPTKPSPKRYLLTDILARMEAVIGTLDTTDKPPVTHVNRSNGPTRTPE